MPYTFGAGTGDDITFTANVSLGGNGSGGLICGWWYPTTLTATRGLWSRATIFGAEIDTTTSEIRLRTDNTTDGQWTTTGAELATQKWSFLAFFYSLNNTGPTAGWRVWMGTIDTAPVALTITQATAPVGNFATGGGAITIGNKGTGTLAFQGDIANFGYYATQAANGSTNPFALATHGTVTADIENHVYRRLVLPYWLGNGWTVGGVPRLTGNFSTSATEAGFVDLDRLVPVVERYMDNPAATNTSLVTTINGATRSLNGAPRPNTVHLAYMPPRVLGR